MFFQSNSSVFIAAQLIYNVVLLLSVQPGD